jgi:hypothetical protein
MVQNRSMQSVQALSDGISSIYSTIVGDSPEAKRLILSAVTDAEPIADHLNEVIHLKDVIVQATTLADDSGEERDALRTILIDADGKAYAAVSDGLFKYLQNMFAILGNPTTWSEPLAIRVVEKRGRKGFRFFTVQLEKGKSEK